MVTNLRSVGSLFNAVVLLHLGWKEDKKKRMKKKGKETYINAHTERDAK